MNIKKFPLKRLKLVPTKVSFAQNCMTFLPNGLNFGILNAKGKVNEINSKGDRRWA